MECVDEEKVVAPVSAEDMTHIMIATGLLEPKVEQPMTQLGQETREETYDGIISIVKKEEEEFMENEQMVSEDQSQMVNSAMAGGVMEQVYSDITSTVKKEEEIESEITEDGEMDNPTPSTSQQVKRRRKTLSKSDQILDTVARKLEESEHKDTSGMDHFGKYVTRRLIAMDQRTATITRKLMNDVLFEAEMGNLNSSSRIVTSHQQTVQLPMHSNNSVYSYCSNSSSNTNDTEMSHFFSIFQP